MAEWNEKNQADQKAVRAISKAVSKDISAQVKAAMKNLDEKIKLASKTWEGVDVDEYMGEVRYGKEPTSDDLKDEIARYLREECSADDEPSISDIARHFYELGCRRIAEMYDDIEYKRQRAEEAELSGEKMFKELGTTKEEYLAKSMDKVHLEMEIATYLQDWEDDDEMGLHLSTDEGCMPIELEDVRDLARHFAEWGAIHLNARKEESK